jgi:hypothetical protein
MRSPLGMMEQWNGGTMGKRFVSAFKPNIPVFQHSNDPDCLSPWLYGKKLSVVEGID